jgi:hypothetical protein
MCDQFSRVTHDKNGKTKPGHGSGGKKMMSWRPLWAKNKQTNKKLCLKKQKGKILGKSLSTLKMK